jgi:hypothetical protein
MEENDSKAKDSANLMARGFTAVLIGLSLLFFACGSAMTPSVSQTSPTSGSHSPATTHLSVSWAVEYRDLGDLKRASDLVVIGSISGIAASTTNRGVPFTDFDVAKINVIYDSKARGAVTSLILHQTGGTVNGQLLQVDDDPLFQVGDDVILFLHEFSTGHFYVVGGPTGRFVVNNNGTVHPISGQGVPVATSTTKAQFVVQIQQA